MVGVVTDSATKQDSCASPWKWKGMQWMDFRSRQCPPRVGEAHAPSSVSAQTDADNSPENSQARSVHAQTEARRISHCVCAGSSYKVTTTRAAGQSSGGAVSSRITLFTPCDPPFVIPVEDIAAPEKHGARPKVAPQVTIGSSPMPTALAIPTANQSHSFRKASYRCAAAACGCTRSSFLGAPQLLLRFSGGNGSPGGRCRSPRSGLRTPRFSPATA